MDWEVICFRLSFSVSFSVSASPRQGVGDFDLGLAGQEVWMFGWIEPNLNWI